MSTLPEVLSPQQEREVRDIQRDIGDVLAGRPVQGYPIDVPVVGAAIQRGAVETIEELSSAIRTFVSDVQRDADPRFGECASPRREAHRVGEIYSRLSGRQPIFALLGHQDIRTLEGRLLTIIDAAFGDGVQRKAVKDLVRSAIWFHWVPNLDTDDTHCGMPTR